MKRALALALLLAAALPAIVQTPNVYYIRREVTSSNVNRITVRQAANGGRGLEFRGAFVVCSGQCTAAIIDGGTISGGSAGTPQKYDKRGGAASASVTLDGTVGGSPVTVISEALSSPYKQTYAADDAQTLHYNTAANSQFTVEAMGSSIDMDILLVYAEP